MAKGGATWDKRGMSGGKHQITLTPENHKELKKLADDHVPKTSVAALVNMAVTTFLPMLQAHVRETKKKLKLS